MSILLGVIVLFALLSLVVAVMHAMAVVRLAPAGTDLAGFMPLGWWKFSQIEAKAGPAAAQKLNIYKRSVVAFIVLLILGLILSGWAVNQTPSTASAAAQLINDLRVIPAELALYPDLRRVAPMPGAPKILES